MDRAQEKKFTVIIPAYNREKIVARTLKSVINQDYSNWECIVIDDCSTDNTLAVCNQFSSDPRFTVISHKINGGLCVARNAGLKIASGDYILFLDSDDALVENTMSVLADTFDKFNADMIAFATKEWIPLGQNANCLLDRGFIEQKVLPEHINITPRTNLFMQPYVWNKCYKRSIIADCNILFDENRRMWEDNLFLVQYLDKCESIVMIDQCLIAMCDEGSVVHLSNNITPNLIFIFIDSYRKYVSQFGRRYNFDNDFTNRRYFDEINRLLLILYENQKEETFRNLIHEMISISEIRDWVEKIEAKNYIEKRIKKAVATSNEDEWANTYKKWVKLRSGLMIRIYWKLKRLIRK